MVGKRPPGLFITGTSTGVGKTWAAASIARSLVAQGYRVGVYKPAASGCRREPDDRLVSEDAVMLWEAAGRPGDLHAVCPQRFEAPLAPHLAARADHRPFDSGLLRSGLEYWLPSSDVILVEGAGGLLSPLGDHEYVADLARDFGYPLVIVAANTIGVINQVLQTVWTAATFRGGLWLGGVLLNHPARVDPHGDPSVCTNADELRLRSPVPLLGELGWDQQDLVAPVAWYELAARQDEARGRMLAAAQLWRS